MRGIGKTPSPQGGGFPIDFGKKRGQAWAGQVAATGIHAMRRNSASRIACRLRLATFRAVLSPAATGTLVWSSRGAITDLVVFDVAESETGFYLTLHYRLGDAGDSGIEGAPPCPPELHHQSPDTREVHIPVRLQETRPTFGGKRWWFTCPLTVNGVACNRRVGKLYLPPGTRYFGCRHCYDLTYWSAQHAHEQARAMAWIKKQWSDLCATWDLGSYSPYLTSSIRHCCSTAPSRNGD